MDADDVSMSERFDKQVAFLDGRRDIMVLGTSFLSMNEDMSRVVWVNSLKADPSEVRAELLERCCVGHPSIMMRRRLVEKIGGYDESEECLAVEDYEMWLRASRSYGISNLPDFLLWHRTSEGQTSRRLGAVQKANSEALRAKYRALAQQGSDLGATASRWPTT
jgi:GT2 family glycosyltransferase